MSYRLLGGPFADRGAPLVVRGRGNRATGRDLPVQSSTEREAPRGARGRHASRGTYYMVAVPEIAFSAPMATSVIERSPVSLQRRRAVAVAVTAMELLRPESDLARAVAAFPHIDVLVIADDEPVSGSVVEALDGYGEVFDDGYDELRADVDQLGVPGLHLHRLGLRQPLGPWAEHDVAAGTRAPAGCAPPASSCRSSARKGRDSAEGWPAPGPPLVRFWPLSSPAARRAAPGSRAAPTPPSRPTPRTARGSVERTPGIARSPGIGGRRLWPVRSGGPWTDCVHRPGGRTRRCPSPGRNPTAATATHGPSGREAG